MDTHYFGIHFLLHYRFLQKKRSHRYKSHATNQHRLWLFFSEQVSFVSALPPAAVTRKTVVPICEQHGFER